MAKWFIPALLLITRCLPAVAQIEKIDTDRPDQTESAFTVPKNWLQQELGFVKEKRSGYLHPLYIWTLPTLLTRIGLSERWEFRVITEYERWGDGSRLFRDTVGFLPLQLGVKVNLIKEKGVIPRISLIAHTGFNKLASDFARGGSFFSRNFRFTLQNSITEKFAIGYNFGAEWEDTNEPPVYIYTFAPGYSINDKWYAYIELFGGFQKNEKPEHNFDGGIAYYINNNCKIDASAGVGLTNNALEHYVALGISFRFKAKKFPN